MDSRSEHDREDMTGHPRVETAIMAGSGVIAADQILEAIKDQRQHRGDDATSHYLKAGVAAAVAVGAYEMLKRDQEEREGREGLAPLREGRQHVHLGDDDRDWSERDWERRSRSRSTGSGHSPDKDPHHLRHLAEEAAGAYALGRQAMGHNQHPIVKLVAEVLGATGLYKEGKHDLSEDGDRKREVE